MLRLLAIALDRVKMLLPPGARHSVDLGLPCTWGCNERDCKQLRSPQITLLNSVSTAPGLMAVTRMGVPTRSCLQLQEHLLQSAQARVKLCQTAAAARDGDSAAT